MSKHSTSKKLTDQEQFDIVRGRDNRLLLGITGGIASGKSTVAKMLEELGAPLVDFDILSRIVVEPGREAWRDIVSFFGEGVLLENRHLDRKKISDMVFQDASKRKKLEGFIHPRIQMEFIRQVEDISCVNPGAIIQVAVPLLIEVNMQNLFHRVIVVYISRDRQIERLMKRDCITRQEALNILNAQMHIDEKLAHADYVIKNENSIEDTRKQVEELWQKLTALQKERCRM
ncbi:MAG: dephospho-CoA kinase [Spirochaetes bacterium]|jgi:dephospho-CoA kinase|nr:dephospho-CoA kinase [Spirochaetota bacterium]